MSTTESLTIPRPSIIIPQFDELPAAIQEVIEQLSKPFPIEEVEVRPGSVRRDGSAALCLAYSNWWTGYLPRLNDLVGPNNWQIDLQPWGEHQVLARLEAFGGLIKGTSSGSGKGEVNTAQEAEVQAKKRVVAEKLLLGLFFYFLPKVWGKGERVGKDFYFAGGEEQKCVHEMYARAGLIARSSPGIAIPGASDTPRLIVTDSNTRTRALAQPSAPASTQSPRPAPASAARHPNPPRIAAAKAVLAQAERATSLAQRGANASAQEPEVTDPQAGKIVLLVQESPATNAQLDELGVRFGFPALSTLDTKAALRKANPGLTKRKASELISALQRLAAEG